MANGFVEVSGYSSTDMANARQEGYDACKADLETLDAGESKTYDAEEMGVVGWNKVEAHAQPKLMQKTITANGEYDASDLDNVDGYSNVIVNVPGGGGGGPFTVTFNNGEQLLQTVQVPYGGTAVFNPQTAGGYPVSPIPNQTFAGWNPSPVNVTDNMNCYAVFKEKQIVLGEIGDDWSVICENRGAGYPLGSYKALAYGATFTDEEYAAAGMTPWSQYTADHVINFQGLAIKVAEGEDGTASSWLWVTLSGSNNNGLVKAVPSNNWQNNGLWRDQVCRTFMNTLFFNHMADIFKNAIKPVTKYSQYSTSNHPPYDVEGEQDIIWIPSVKEMIGTDEDDFLASEPPVPKYGSETIQETNYNKYVTYVPDSIAYFKDNLEMTASERDAFLYRNLGLQSPMRDMSDNTYASSLNLWTNGQFRHSRNNSNGAGGHYFNGEYTQDQVILGFCMG